MVSHQLKNVLEIATTDNVVITSDARQTTF